MKYREFVKVKSGFYAGVSGTVVARKWPWWYTVDGGIVVTVPRWRLKRYTSPVAEKFREKRIQRDKDDARKVSK